MSSATDYAESRLIDAWLRHPVLGDASFDAFVRPPGNPIYRGSPPREWAVNGFLFRDPKGEDLFAYVGRYPRDYQCGPKHAPADCLVLRSRDDGKTWAEVGPVFGPGEFRFEGDDVAVGSAPDVTVAYADGRYHLAYDWVHADTTWDHVFSPDADHDSGMGYAWAERPEGPYHRHPQPIVRNLRHVSPVPDKYRRLYASTLLRRGRDWLLLTLADSAQRFAWGLYALTAADPRGPWSEPRLVLSLEGGTYHPALMEFFPQFVHAGMVYAPATSVAMNRNFQCLWRAPLTSAHEPAAWELHQQGSLWHREPRDEEQAGIWGQTFSGTVDDAGRLQVLFPSRDDAGRGTINLAERPWAQPLRDRGLVLSGAAGTAISLLRHAYGEFAVRWHGHLHGNARLLWGWRGVLGPDRHGADATLHAAVCTNCHALAWDQTGWRLQHHDAAGAIRVYAEGVWLAAPTEMSLQVTASDEVRFEAGELRWTGHLPAANGPIGLWVAPRSRLEVTTMAVSGCPVPCWMRWHCLDALAATGALQSEWDLRPDEQSPGGEILVGRESGGQLKWNFFGTGVRWWAPRGPELGRVRLKLDGKNCGEIDLSAPEFLPAAAVFVQERLRDGGHALVLEAITGRLATGGIEVLGPG